MITVVPFFDLFSMLSSFLVHLSTRVFFVQKYTSIFILLCMPGTQQPQQPKSVPAPKAPTSAAPNAPKIKVPLKKFVVAPPVKQESTTPSSKPIPTTSVVSKDAPSIGNNGSNVVASANNETSAVPLKSTVPASPKRFPSSSTSAQSKKSPIQVNPEIPLNAEVQAPNDLPEAHPAPLGAKRVREEVGQMTMDAPSARRLPLQDPHEIPLSSQLPQRSTQRKEYDFLPAEDDDEYEYVTERLYVKIPAFDHFINLKFDEQIDLVRARIRFSDWESSAPKMFFLNEVSASSSQQNNDCFYFDGNRPVLTSSGGSTANAAPIYRRCSPIQGDTTIVAAFEGSWEGSERRITGLTSEVICTLTKDGNQGTEEIDDDSDVASPISTIPSVFNQGGVTISKKQAGTQKERSRKTGSTLFRQLTTGRKATAETAGWAISSLVPVKSSIVMKRLI